MAFSQAHKILCFTGIVFLILPDFNLGLLSDYKICGDSECESLMSRVQAVRDHHGKDCRFLSFRRGDTIFVYHKLTGKREDLWAGTIDRQFGYFPKDAVQEEQVYATTEKVVETLKSDFFCIDEFGNLIDSSNLDNNDDDGDNDVKKIQNQESETTQTIVHTDDTSAESPLTSIDPPRSPQQPDGTTTEEDENKNAVDTAATTHEETHETPAAPSEQGGSSSSSWLGSSVTGWLSLGKEEQPGTLAEGEKKDEQEKTQAEASLTSSVTGWLGFGGEGKPDDAVNNREEDKETAASFTSSMTGWLGFGGEKQSESEKEQHEERQTDDESEPKETFRSRRMSLDLEGSQLEEEEKDTGTLAWLGNGLSSTLGFGMTKQESEPIKEEKEKPVSSSWLDIGVGDILGFGNYKSEVDESRSGFKEAEKDATLEQVWTSESADISQSQPAQTEDEKTEPDIQILEENVEMETTPEVELHTNKSNVEEHDRVSQSETDSATLAPEDDSDNNNKDASDGSKGSILSADAVARGNQKNISSQTMFQEKSQAVGGTSSVTDQERSVESEGEEHEVHKPKGNDGEDNNREPGEEEIKTASDNGKDFLTQSDTDLGSDIFSIDSKEHSAVNIKESTKDQLQSKTAESLEEARAKITSQAGNTEESTVMSVESGANNDNHEGQRSYSEELHRRTYTTPIDESAEQSQVNGSAEESRGTSPSSLRSDTAKEGNEPTHSEDNNITAHSVTTDPDNLDKVAMIDDRNTDREPHHSETVQDGEAHTYESSSQEFKSSHSDNSLYGNASEDQTLTVTQDSTDQNSGSLKTEEVEVSKEEEKHKELKEVKEMKEEDRWQTVEEGKQEVVEIKEEMQEEVYKLKKKEKQEDVNELKKEDRHEGKKEQEETEELKKEEKQEEVDDLKGERRQEEIGEEEREKENQEVEELKEEEKREEVVDVKEEKQEGLGEAEKDKKKEGVEALKTEEKHDEVEELVEGEKGEQVVEVTDEEKQEGLGEVEKDEKKEGVEELKEEEKQYEVEELVEEEKGDQVREVIEEVKQDKTKETQMEEKQAKVEEFEEEKKHEEVVRQAEMKGLKEEKKQEEVQTLKEGEQREEVKEENRLQETEMEEGEEKQIQALPHLDVQKKNTHDVGKPESESSEKETHEEVANTEEEKREENKTKHENVEQAEEGGRRDMEEKESLKCSNKHCHEATEGESVMDTDANISGEGPSSTNKATTHRRKQNDEILAERTGESKMIPSEGTERKRLGEEEKEKTSNDLEADEGDKNIMLNASGHEGIYDNNANVSDYNDLVVEQIGATSYTDNEQHPASKNGHHGLPNEMGQRAETEEQHHLAKGIDLSDHDTFSQGHKGLKLDGSETSSNRIPSDKINSEHKMEESHNHQTVPHIFQDPVGSSVPSGDENESAGAFGLFKNAFSFFSPTPATETKDTTESAQSLDTNTAETSQSQASLTPEREPDSKTHSSQVSVEDTHKDSLISTSTQQRRQPPHSTEVHSHLYTPSPSTETHLQTKALSKHYKNLLSHVSGDEMMILMDFFGRNKLQFLDYILGSSETVTDDPDNDESILSDIERLLLHHRETLVTPRISLAHAPSENKEKTRTLIAFEKLEMLLGKLREIFNTRKSHITKVNLQAEASCVGASCSTHSKYKEELKKTQDSSVAQDVNIQRDEWNPVEKDNVQLGGVLGKARQTEEWKRGQREIKEEHAIPESHPHIHQGSPQPLEGVSKQTLDMIRQVIKDSVTYAHAARELIIWITVQVVSLLPDDIRPGPDLYGVPWEPVIISSLVGLLTMLLFTCRCYSSVKSRMYRSRERWMAEQVAQLLDEKCKVLETLSKCQQEYDDLEDSLRDSGVLAQTQKTEEMEIKARQMEHAKKEMDRDIGQLKDLLEQQQEHRIEQERRIAVLEESMKTLEDETKDLQSQEEQAQTTLKVYSMNSDRLQRNLETAGEENTLLQESNAQLRQQVEGWAERVSELEAEMRRCEVSYSGMQQDVANKDERIMSLTDHLLRMKAWDSDLEEEEDERGQKETSNGTAGKGEESKRGDTTDTQGHLQKVQKLIYAAKLNADLKSLDEDKDRVFAKLNDEVKAKEDLQESMKELENEKLSLQSEAEQYTDQVQRLQQKLQIMTEMYQENELKLHRLLTVEERERLQKEEKLNKADKNIAMAIEEVNNYRQRAEEMEEELEKTKQSYQTQISAHEKKAHNNWLAARAAERELADIRRENALFRQKLTDTQFKLDAIDKDPYALDSLARPLPFRAERSPYGPSPLGRPASETRPFLSPPTLMEGPPTRLSPRVSRGPVEPPGGLGELERSGGPHSDSGSISPTWERDRRGPPLGLPPGYMFPEPGGPMYRRPPPPPGAVGILPPPGSLPPGPPHPRSFLSGPPAGPPHPTDVADGPYRENRLVPGEQEHRESGPSDRRTPPDADPRMGGPPPPGPPVGPMDGPFPRRGPYGPPPPDFYPPRGPGGPPMRPMWASPPPGMMFPPRFLPGGAPLPPGPHPHYAPHMRPPVPEGLPPPSTGPAPPQQSLPSQPHSQSQEEHTASPEDAI